MIIDEAIKLIQEDIDGNYYEQDSPLEKAVKLGIEALKRIQMNRIWPEVYHGGLLPGETEE